ncbi:MULTISPECIES: succinate dehydrogenase, hydrophobic membrane anchor protein [Bacteria]|uniref:succinate dehydrogenase, hydrophobic membrane anchor protein n=1 Tax=Bacteria TaxID=2 RepID=UPI001040C3BF|nr:MULTISPECIES: succinate dehydrogenase, hydrophobic membrane anchor protein [Bacteria]QDM40147.1 succinate dehydrogenase, hydrophobic membrane anchor protein [Altererythrobacter sp. TH136]TCJ37282.1 succinate dehydrogenase, hydrophobic membrane anchor protein [Parafrankia sp. BMG5.11]
MGDGTELGRVRGLGSARTGAHHWLIQRFTAIGNILGGLFLAFGLALLPSHDFAAMKDWVASPLPALVLALWVPNVFWHARHGLQILVDDYVHDAGNHLAISIVLNILAVVGAGLGVLSIIRLALSGAA